MAELCTVLLRHENALWMCVASVLRGSGSSGTFVLPLTCLMG